MSARYAIEDPDRIQPYSKNRFYWQYKQKPVLLLGGSKTDNLFQIPDLVEHLDEMVEVGANYIRNTMHGRLAHGYEVLPFKTEETGRCDLEQWNPEYWDRFARMLAETRKREIFVQIELFDEHAHTQRQWDERSAWNPDNNVNYTTKNTHLRGRGSYPAASRPHDFFYSVPECGTLEGRARDPVVLKFQQAYVDRVLAYSLPYNHVLYTVSNELFAIQGWAWGYYWARYVRNRAREAGKEVETSEMYWQVDMMHPEQRWSLDNPGIFTFFEASQNSANQNSPAKHWENLQFVRHYLSRGPRPINHTKTYGSDKGPSFACSDDETVRRFVRSVIGGAASMRFHRPDTGLGLNATAKNVIRAVRQATDVVPLWECRPRQDLLHALNPDAAYLAANPGKAYALYFTDGGAVGLDLTDVPGRLPLRWFCIDAGEEKPALRSELEAGRIVTIQAPAGGDWIAAIGGE
ncbi:MAG: hypothetical protein JXR37_25100 [Kiritimatiellae bacterium]|nr:hypothetical protein [Kiritimatiellia bacterium]